MTQLNCPFPTFKNRAIGKENADYRGKKQFKGSFTCSQAVTDLNLLKGYSKILRWHIFKAKIRKILKKLKFKLSLSLGYLHPIQLATANRYKQPKNLRHPDELMGPLVFSMFLPAFPAINRSALGRLERDFTFLATIGACRLVHFTWSKPFRPTEPFTIYHFLILLFFLDTTRKNSSAV